MTDNKDLKKEKEDSIAPVSNKSTEEAIQENSESKKEQSEKTSLTNEKEKSAPIPVTETSKADISKVEVITKLEKVTKDKTTDMKDKKQFVTHKSADQLIKEIHEVAQELNDVSNANSVAELSAIEVNTDNLIPIENVPTNSTITTKVEQSKTHVETPDLATPDPKAVEKVKEPGQVVEEKSSSVVGSKKEESEVQSTENTPKNNDSEQEVKDVSTNTEVVPPQTPEDQVVRNMVAEAGGKKEAKTLKTSILSKLFSKFQKKSKLDNKSDQVSVQPKSKVKKTLLIVGLLLLVLILLVGGISVLAYFQIKPVLNHGLKTIEVGKQAYQALKSQNLVEASNKLTESKQEFEALQSSYQKISWLKFIPGINKYQADGESALNAGFAGIEAAEIGVDAITPYADVLGFNGEGTFAGGTVEDRIVNTVATLDKVTPKLDDISQKWSVVQSEMSKIDSNDYPEEFRGKKVRENIIKAQTLINDTDLALTDAKPIVKILPQLLGYPDPKTYMIIFQNDGEIRPTGGFMSAFAILKLDKGRIIPEKSDDIYSLDRKFNSRNVQPPEAISKYLNEKTWYLRNMNFSPDFYQSMAIFKKNYDTLDDEVKIDGIITIDTQVLKGLIEVLGSIDVPGYGTFTAENDSRCDLPQIVCELEYIVDKPLPTMVSNRKSSILGPMMQVLVSRSLGGGKEQLTKLVPLAFDLLSQKHILTYFTDDSAQKAAEMFAIAGRIKDFDGDYLHINNANLGGAKSNFYITNDFTQDIEIKDDGTVIKKLELKFNHNRASDNCNLESGDLCLSGIQQDYFRVYVPKGSKLIEALGTEDEIKSQEDNDLNKTYFEGFFKLNPESRSIIRLTYELPFKVKKGSMYKMLIQKQPGTQSDKYVVNVNGQKDEFNLDKDTEKQWQL